MEIGLLVMRLRADVERGKKELDALAEARKLIEGSIEASREELWRNERWLRYAEDTATLLAGDKPKPRPEVWA